MWRISLLLMAVWLLSACVFAQDVVIDSVAESGGKWWLPTSGLLQHAGSIGYISGGVGYNLNKRGRTTLDLLYGHVPKSKGGPLNIFTAKIAWRPFSVKLWDWGILHPLNPGFFVSYHGGRHFDSKWDDNNYPKGYYWWSTAIRPHISISHEVILFPKMIKKSIPLEKIGLYVEYNANELYLISHFQNKEVSTIQKTFKMGLGIRTYF